MAIVARASPDIIEMEADLDASTSASDKAKENALKEYKRVLLQHNESDAKVRAELCS